MNAVRCLAIVGAMLWTTAAAADCQPTNDAGQACIKFNRTGPVEGYRSHSGIWFDNICSRDVSVRLMTADGKTLQVSVPPASNYRAFHCATKICGGFTDYDVVCDSKKRAKAAVPSAPTKAPAVRNQAGAIGTSSVKGLKPAEQKAYSACMVHNQTVVNRTQSRKTENDTLKKRAASYSGPRRSQFLELAKKHNLAGLWADYADATKQDSSGYCYYTSKNWGGNQTGLDKWFASAEGRAGKAAFDRYVAANSRLMSQVRTDAEMRSSRQKPMWRPSADQPCVYHDGRC